MLVYPEVKWNSGNNEKVHHLEKKKRKRRGERNSDNTETSEMMESEVTHVSKHPF
jgi:hypothetical protein